MKEEMNEQKEVRNDVKVIAEAQHVVVTRSFKKGEEVSADNEYINVRKFHSEPAKVTYWGSAKVNTGNYENVDVGVSISVPCYLEEAADAYEFAKKFSSDRLTEEIRGVRKFLGEKVKK